MEKCRSYLCKGRYVFTSFSFEIVGTLVSFLFGVRSSALLFPLGCCISVVISAVLGRNSQNKHNCFSNLCCTA